MDLPALELLLTPLGSAALQAVGPSLRDDAFLPTYERLRKRFPPDLAKAAVETVILRTRAAVKFRRADRMLFTREALEQATAEPLSRHRAERFRGCRTVLDLCCGIGADSIGLTGVVPNVIAIDNDPVRGRMAAENVRVYERTGTFMVLGQDVLTEPLPPADAFFCDPARRADGKRFLSVDQYLPAPTAVLDRFPATMPGAFKLSPGVPLEDLDDFRSEVEFVSWHGELRECVLWLGGFAGPKRRATLLPSGASLTGNRPTTVFENVGPIQNYLYDPDAAVCRAGLAGELCQQLNGSMLDGGIACITSADLTETAFASSYAVIDSIRYDVKRFRAWVRNHKVGRITLVNRGSGLDGNEISKGLKLSGTKHHHVLMTRREGVVSAILLDRLT